tara:strand:+ start:569 stop:868 length:300 start_codon:yes stop_codon:yes gene_type:complete
VNGETALEFGCLEDAHVLGQESTIWHTRVHIEMMLWGARNSSLSEVSGQLLRIVGALTKTAVGFVPEGNTGGSNVSPFRPMPIRADLEQTISHVRASDY